MSGMLCRSLWAGIMVWISSFQALQAEKVFHIRSQSEFGRVSGVIGNYLNGLSRDAAETCTVSFSGGTYLFDATILFSGLRYPNVSLHFTAAPGETVHLIAGGNTYTPSDATGETATHYFVRQKGAYCRGEVFVDQHFNRVPVSDSGDLSPAGINRAASSREKIRRVANGKFPVDYARFKLPRELSFLKNKDAAYFSDKLICFKLWYSQCYGSIAKTDDEYIYFYHNASSMFDVIQNSPDWDAWKGYPLFYITNVTGSGNQPEEGKILVTSGGMYVPKGVTTLYECKRQILAGFWDVSFREIQFSDLHFSGAASFDYDTYYAEEQAQHTQLTYDGVSYYRASLMSFVNTGHVVFQRCAFRNIGSNFAVSVTTNDTYRGDGGFTFYNNTATDIGGQVVQSYADHTNIERNRIHNTGWFSHGRPDPILVTSPGYLVANNTLSDFTGNGITIGYNLCGTLMNDHPIQGIVRENELYMTPGFLSRLERHTLEDTHAIYYVNHQTYSSCLDNIIHDFEGYKFADGTGRCNNKAIVVDCEGYNVHVIGNLAYNLADLAFHVEYYDGDHAASATNIYLRRNVFFSPYQFVGNPSDPTSSESAGNYLAVDRNGEHSELLAGLSQKKLNIRKGMDYTDTDAVVRDGKCYITKDISALDLSPFVKSRIVHSNVATAKPEVEAGRIRSSGGYVCVRSSAGQTVAVYTMDGRLVKTVDAGRGETFILLEPGFYAVKSEDGLNEKVYIE